MTDDRYLTKRSLARLAALSPRRTRGAMVAITILLTVLAAGCDTSQASEEGVDASGFIEARSYALASESGGTLSEVLVTTGDSVLAGQELLSLNPAGLESARIQAEAAVTAARAALQILRDQPSDVVLLIEQAALSEANGKQEAAEAELALLIEIYSPYDPPDADIHSAEAKVEIAKAEVQLVLAELERVEAGALAGEIKVAEAALAEVEAALSLVVLQIEMMTLASPVDGVVGEVLANVGETAAPGAPLIEIHEVSDLRLTVYVAETHVASLTVGDEVEVTVDAYPLETWMGRIERIADQAQFTPSNVQTVEERVKLVFAVEIALDDEAGRLKAGMPADVKFQQ